jgi:hypothetical protein
MWRVRASAYYYRSGHYQQALATGDDRVATQLGNLNSKAKEHSSLASL